MEKEESRRSFRPRMSCRYNQERKAEDDAVSNFISTGRGARVKCYGREV